MGLFHLRHSLLSVAGFDFSSRPVVRRACRFFFLAGLDHLLSVYTAFEDFWNGGNNFSCSGGGISPLIFRRQALSNLRLAVLVIAAAAAKHELRHILVCPFIARERIVSPVGTVFYQDNFMNRACQRLLFVQNLRGSATRDDGNKQ